MITVPAILLAMTAVSGMVDAVTSIVAYSAAIPLFVCGVMTAICALARLHLSRKELSDG